MVPKAALAGFGLRAAEGQLDVAALGSRQHCR
jgi:hypothetical protein